MATQESSSASNLQEAREKYAFFWKADSPFSQWHSSSFHVDGQKFINAEQYMMHQKAGEYYTFPIILQRSYCARYLREEKL